MTRERIGRWLVVDEVAIFQGPAEAFVEEARHARLGVPRPGSLAALCRAA